MGAIGTLGAVVLPWLCATLLLALAWREAQPGRWPYLIGYGYLLGTVASGLLLRAQGGLMGSLQPVFLVGLWALAAAVGAVLFWRGKRLIGSPAGPTGTATGEQTDSPRWARATCVVLLAWLAFRYAVWAVEVTKTPIFPWDAWTTWAYRAKLWSLTGTIVPFVTPETWWTPQAGSAHTVAAAQYPLLPSLIMAWPAVAAGHWDETAASLPWLGLAVALGLGMFGQLRLWGASTLGALLAVWVLASLPILGTHVALAGYFDLWLATALGFSFMSFMRWVRWRQPRDAAIAGAMAICCLLLKNEGVVWVLFFIPACLAIWVGLRGWLLCLGALLALVGLLSVSGGVGFDWPGGGRAAISLERVELPRIGRIEFGLEADALRSVVLHLFVFDSWHLGVYAFLSTVVVFLLGAARASHEDFRAAWSRAGIAWVVAATAAFLFLFFLTRASLWATTGTSVNRILLQFAPAFVFWSVTVWLVEMRAVLSPARGPGAAVADEQSAGSPNSL